MGRASPTFSNRHPGAHGTPSSEEPICDPPQPSITVKMSDRTNWGGLWEEQHEHAQPGGEGCVFGPSDDEDDPGHLLECCDETDRKHRGLWCVNASVHDYVSAVRPWSMSHFDVIPSAANVWEEAPAG
ncbi:hypothetical protein MHUMG1_06964 [Metarhizium humberi]|uniref:Uncharacterized protein n=1 Tax=Metarhizium humberi TaxID=2596975 RepID=A0A9P8M6X6_9HYPO|nr:hypothetical protein MHUMG1_06964 [Metarhizium humberi]